MSKNKSTNSESFEDGRSLTFRFVLDALNRYAKQYPKLLDQPMTVAIRKTPRTKDIENVFGVGIDVDKCAYIETETASHRELG